jgi:putative membrane protein
VNPNIAAVRARRTHPVSIVFEALDLGVRDAVLFALLVISTGGWWLLPVGLVALLVISTVRWYRSTWSFDGSTVVADRGVFQRSHREIPVHRIQQVDLVRRVRHQLLGMTTVRIETSGGATSSELELAVVPAQEAEEIRALLLAARDEGDSPPAPDRADGPDPEVVRPRPDEEVLLTLPARRLVVAGLTGPQLLALPLALAWLVNLADDLPASVAPDLDTNDVEALGLFTIGLFAAGLVMVWILVAVIAGMITYHGLTVTRVGNDLRIRRGLFDRRDTSIPLARVQLVQLTAHPVHRVLGLVDLRVVSAGRAGPGTAGTDRAVVPVLTVPEVEHLLAIILPQAMPRPSLVPAPTRARLRQLVGPLVRTAVLVAAALLCVEWLGVDARAPELTVTSLALAAAVVFGIATYRGLGASEFGPVIASQRGAIVRRTDLVPLARLQSTRRTASFFQRRRRLATLWLDVSGLHQGVALVDRDADEAEHLLERLATTDAARADDAHQRHPADPNGVGTVSGTVA